LQVGGIGMRIHRGQGQAGAAVDGPEQLAAHPAIFALVGILTRGQILPQPLP
jgi:hypothetical protein